jgi:ParB family chromosome partitioning protein
MSAVDQAESQVVLLDPDCVRRHRLAPRTIYAAATLDERIESIRASGQREPIKVRPSEVTGEYYVIDGWTRTLAQKALGQLVRAVIQDMSDEEAAFIGYTLNEQREAMVDYDRGKFFAALLDGAGHGVKAKIAAQYGIDKSNLNKYLDFARLSSPVADTIAKYGSTVGYSSAPLLARYEEMCGADATVVLIETWQTKKKPMTWLKGEVAKSEATSQATSDADARMRRNRWRMQFNGGVYRRQGTKFALDCEVSPERQAEFDKKMQEVILHFWPESESHQIDTE